MPHRHPVRRERRDGPFVFVRQPAAHQLRLVQRIERPHLLGRPGLFGAGPERQRHCGIFHCKRPAGGAQGFHRFRPERDRAGGKSCGQQARVPHCEHFTRRRGSCSIFVWVFGHGTAVFDKAWRLRHHGAGHYRGKIQPEPQLLPEREAAGGKWAGGSVRAGL